VFLSVMIAETPKHDLWGKRAILNLRGQIWTFGQLGIFLPAG